MEIEVENIFNNTLQEIGGLPRAQVIRNTN